MAEKKSSLQQAARSLDSFMEKHAGPQYKMLDKAVRTGYNLGLKIKKLKHPKARSTSETIRSSLELIGKGIARKKAP